MKCHFCNLQAEESSTSQVFICNNHKVKVAFYHNSISFLTNNYIVYMHEGKNITLYHRFGQYAQIKFPYFPIIPENAEFAVDKILKLNAFS